MQGRISLLAREAIGGVYQSVYGKHPRLRLLLIKHDVPLKSAVFRAGTWGDHLHALCWRKMIGNVICQQHWVDLFDIKLRKLVNEYMERRSDFSSLKSELLGFNGCLPLCFLEFLITRSLCEKHIYIYITAVHLKQATFYMITAQANAVCKEKVKVNLFSFFFLFKCSNVKNKKRQLSKVKLILNWQVWSHRQKNALQSWTPRNDKCSPG